MSGRKRVRGSELGMSGTEQQWDCVNAAMSTAGTKQAGDLLAIWAISYCQAQLLLLRNISDNFLLRASSNDRHLIRLNGFSDRWINCDYGELVEKYAEEKPKYLENSLAKCHGVHYKFQMEWSGITPGSLRSVTCDRPLELQL